MNILKHLPRSIKKLHKDIFPVYATGCYIYTPDKKKYLDLTSGIGALSLGHNHPHVTEKVTDQLTKYVHIPQQVFKSHPAQVELTKKILNISPSPKLDNILYVNSGSEATDNAIKIARASTGKSNIISLNGGFHGRTLGALSVTSSNLACTKNISPLISNIFFCPTPTKEAINQVLEFQSSPDNTAAIMFETVQGDGGIFGINSEFIKYVRKICTENNILLIIDEVQCGSMRTGAWWSIEHSNVVPDIMTFGKGIANGYPLAGIIGTSDIMNSLQPGSLGGTYGGNAICSAAASATIDILNDSNIRINTIEMGRYITEQLKGEILIREIRQYGLMIGIEFYDNTPEYSMKLVEELKKEGVLVLLCGNKSQYIRILPPLIISKLEVDYFLEKFKKILDANRKIT